MTRTTSFKKNMREKKYFWKNKFTHKINLQLTPITIKTTINNPNCLTKALIPLLNFSKDIYITETLNFRSLKDPIRHIKSSLWFMQRLPED